jgi:hypothetical protein
MSPQFIRDRQRGKPGQQYVAAMLREWGLRVDEVPDGFFQAYDLDVIDGNGRHRYFEVKYDYRSHLTGNVFLEEEALNHSQAEWLAIVTDNPRRVFLIPLTEARRIANEYPKKVRGGEFNGWGAIPSMSFLAQQPFVQVLTAN